MQKHARLYSIPEPAFITSIKSFFKHHGTWPRIINPQTFNEKVLNRIIFDRDPRSTQLADKYAMRAFVEKRVDADVLPKLYHVTETPEDIPFDDLPHRFVVKPTHGCGWVQVVDDKSQLDRPELIAKCQEWLKSDYYIWAREWQYKDIPRRIIVEERIDDGSAGSPIDYKLMVFNGKVRVITVHQHRFKENSSFACYDTSWNKLNVQALSGGKPNPAPDVPKPKHLKQMLSVAEALGKGLDFIRVDLYDEPERKMYVGELTGTPGAARYGFIPQDFDLYMGQLWDQEHSAIPKILNKAHQLTSSQRTILAGLWLHAADEQSTLHDRNLPDDPKQMPCASIELEFKMGNRSLCSRLHGAIAQKFKRIPEPRYQGPMAHEEIIAGVISYFQDVAQLAVATRIDPSTTKGQLRVHLNVMSDDAITHQRLNDIASTAQANIQDRLAHKSFWVARTPSYKTAQAS